MFAPSLAQADYNDANMLGVAGNQLQQYQQANLQNAYQRWYDQNRAPLQNGLDMLASAINTGRGLGSNSQSQSPYASNLAGNLIGGGLLGYQAYNALAGATPAYSAITYGAPAGYSAAASDAALIDSLMTAGEFAMA